MLSKHAMLLMAWTATVLFFPAPLSAGAWAEFTQPLKETIKERRAKSWHAPLQP